MREPIRAGAKAAREAYARAARAQPDTPDVHSMIKVVKPGSGVQVVTPGKYCHASSPGKYGHVSPPGNCGHTPAPGKCPYIMPTTTTTTTVYELERCR